MHRSFSGIFHIASAEDIKSGAVTDVYFSRTIEILETAGVSKDVRVEVRATKLPREWKWGILAGVEEVCRLFEGIAVDVLSLPEGTVFEPGVPVLQISGKYNVFGTFETSLLGLLCQASGIATMGARCRIAAGEKKVLSFGARRMHPALSPMIDRAAFIGGCDGVAVIKSAELLGIEPSGTMPHAFILIMGDPVEAFKLFHKATPTRIKRIALIDTFGDEKFEAVKAAESLGEALFAVRLDTPSSRRGDFRAILEEVRWELDLRGFKNVKLFVSGGLDEYRIKELEFADAYGVGTALSNAPVIDFSMDVVEVDGTPLSKRGKKSGAKKVLRCRECFKIKVIPWKEDRERCECGGEYHSILNPMVKRGEIEAELPSPKEIRDFVLTQIDKMRLIL